MYNTCLKTVFDAVIFVVARVVDDVLLERQAGAIGMRGESLR